MFYRICFFTLIVSLTACAHFDNIHNNVNAHFASDLTKRHVYPVPATFAYQNFGWWQSFDDPQLNQLILIALLDSPDMQAAEARLKRAQQLASEAAASIFPFITMSGDLERDRFSQYGLVPPPFNGKTFNIGILGLTLDYNFDFWGKNRKILAIQVSEACAAQADKAEARLILSSMVANTYFQLIGNIAQLGLAKKNLSLTKQMSDIVNDRAKKGILSNIPVNIALANLQNAKLNLAHYQKALKFSRNQLAVLLGKNPFTTEVLTRKFQYHQYDAKIPDKLTANCLAKRPDIDAAKHRVRAAAEAVNVAKTRFLPDINLRGLFSYESVLLNQLFNPASQHNALGLAFDLPIFDAGARKANLGVKYAEFDAAVSHYHQTILKALHEVSDQLAALSTVKTELNAQNELVSSTLQNTKLYSSKYNHGTIDYLQVLEIKQSLLTQQSIKLALQIQQQQTVVMLFKALGGNV